jgi:hypothetical protein
MTMCDIEVEMYTMFIDESSLSYVYIVNRV